MLRWMVRQWAVLGIVYAAISTVLLGRLLVRRKTPAPDPEDLPSATWFRPMKPDDPFAPGRIRLHLAALRPGDQLLVGVSESDSIAWEDFDDLKDPRVVLLRCQTGRALNPKINKLLQLEPLARHPLWVTLDSEARIDSAFVNDLIQHWTGSRPQILTTAYQFGPSGHPAGELDRLAPASLHWPGVAVATLGNPTDLPFAFGAGMVMEQSWLKHLGGWEAFADHLAEDHALARATAEQGGRVELARCVLTLDPDPAGFGSFLRHQLRVARTYRAANPRGFAGLPLVQGLGWLLLPALLRRNPIPVFLLWGVKVLSVYGNARLLGMKCLRPLNLLWQVPILAVVESIAWLLAWIPLPIFWAGRAYKVRQDGRLQDSN